MSYTIKRSAINDDNRLDLPDIATRERGNGKADFFLIQICFIY